MKVQVYAVYDSVAGFYHPPFFIHNNGMAIRHFASDCNNPNHHFNKSPGDFALFHLGEWDDSTGIITNNNAPINLGMANSFIERN